MLAPEKVRVVEAQLGIADALTGNWLPKNSPYGQLVRAERTASRMTHAGYIPGVLLDMDFTVTDQRLAGRRLELLAARQELAAARVAAGELAVEVLLTSDMITPVALASPDHFGPQLRRLAAAAAEGWSLRKVPATSSNHYLRRMESMILVGDPAQPDAAYFERQPGYQPHETWNTAPEVLNDAGGIYEALSSVAASAEETRAHIEQQAALLK